MFTGNTLISRRMCNDQENADSLFQALLAFHFISPFLFNLSILYVRCFIGFNMRAVKISERKQKISLTFEKKSL